jgi:hypothetical protein
MKIVESLMAIKWNAIFILILFNISILVVYPADAFQTASLAIFLTIAGYILKDSLHDQPQWLMNGVLGAGIFLAFFSIFYNLVFSSGWFSNPALGWLVAGFAGQAMSLSHNRFIQRPTDNTFIHLTRIAYIFVWIVIGIGSFLEMDFIMLNKERVLLVIWIWSTLVFINQRRNYITNSAREVLFQITFFLCIQFAFIFFEFSILSLIFVLVATYQLLVFDESNNHIFQKRFNNDNIYNILIISLISVFTAFRLINLGRLGVSFDEGLIYMSVEGIRTNGYPIMPEGFIYLRGAVYTYLLAGMSMLTGNSLTLIRSLSVISWVISVIVTWRILSRLRINNVIQVSVVFFLSSHYWTIMLSRWGRMYYFAIALLLLTLFFLVRYIQGSKKRDLLGVILFGFLAILTHNTGYVVIIYPFTLIWLELIKQKKNLRSITTYSIITVAFLVFRQLWSNIVSQINKPSNSLIAEQSSYQSERLIENILSRMHLNVNLDLSKLNPLLTLFGFTLVLTIISLTLIINKKLSQEKKAILSICLLTIILTLMYSSPIIGGRIVHFQLYLYLISVAILVNSLQKTQIIAGSTVIALSALFNNGLFVPFLNYGDPIIPEYFSSHVVPFYADNQTPSEELMKIIQPNDKVIFFGYPIRSFPYLKDLSPSQIYQVSDDQFKKKDNYWGYNIINTPEEVDGILDNKGNVYAISTFSVLSYKVPHLHHFDSQLWDHLQNNYKVINLYMSQDKVSGVYRIEEKVWGAQ